MPKKFRGRNISRRGDASGGDSSRPSQPSTYCKCFNWAVLLFKETVSQIHIQSYMCLCSQFVFLCLLGQENQQTTLSGKRTYHGNKGGRIARNRPRSSLDTPRLQRIIEQDVEMPGSSTQGRQPQQL